MHPEFYITDTTNPNFHEHPFSPVYAKDGTVPANPDIVVKHGTIEEWYIFNATLEVHSFHIHHMAFAAEDEPGGPAMLDTATIPVGKVLSNAADPNYPLIQPSRTRVLLDFRNVPRGEFVFHCHMLFHEDRGMMATIRVE
jgi:FtsP/CotA-like multicopper oxidase with cupredoxin domain